MNNTTRNGLWFAFLLCFFAVGVPYWLMPYNKVNLPNALIAPGLILVVGAPLILRACAIATFWRAVTIVGMAVPAAVIARVVWDGLKNPSSHNLWPLEVIIAMTLGLCCALAGALAGSLVLRLRSKRNGTGKS